MRTVFDIFSRKQKFEEQFEIDCPLANPLNLKFNSLISIPSVYLPNEFTRPEEDFKLTAIDEYTRHLDGASFVFSDYALVDREGRYSAKLRVYKTEALILNLSEEMAYSDTMYNILVDTERTGMFEIIEGDSVLHFKRVNNLKRHWDASVKKLIDADNNGKITKTDPIITSSIKYWDFVRQDENNKDVFLIIEMNKENGWIAMWEGRFIDPQSVTII